MFLKLLIAFFKDLYCTKNIPFIKEVIYKPVEGEVKGLADVRNITVVQNDSDTYKVKVYNVESEINMLPLIPDSVNCDPGEQIHGFADIAA